MKTDVERKAPSALRHPMFAAMVVLLGSLSVKAVRADGGALDGGVDGSAPSSPAPESPERYTVQNGVVYDTRTKLRWQQIPAPNPLEWAAGRDYCAALSLDGNGWRLPSVAELQTLVDETKSDPSIDGVVFPGTPSEYFWTSSPLPRFDAFIWTVYFGYGLSTFFQVNQTHHVRCVR